MARDGELIQTQYFLHHTDTICHPNSSYVTTKLYETSACGRNNNTIFQNELFLRFLPSKYVAWQRRSLGDAAKVGGTISSVTVPDLSNFTPATMQEVEELIKRSPAKSCGLDPVSTWLMKQHAECLVPIITSIVNMSLADGVFPDQFKTAHVCPLIKKSTLDCNVLKNYRPVSNLPYISKIVEKVVDARLQKHLQDNQLYEPMQSAYRPAHSTETALVRVTNDLLCTIDNQQAVILILLDLSAAFDTVDHNILLQRLHEEIGVCWVPLQWFESYLTGRKQAIASNKTSSSECDLIYGVPHGSVLGPIMLHQAAWGHCARAWAVITRVCR